VSDDVRGNRLVALCVAASLALHAAVLGLAPDRRALPFEPARVLSVVLEAIREPPPRAEAVPPPAPPVARPRPPPPRARAQAPAPAPAPVLAREPEPAAPALSQPAAEVAAASPQAPASPPVAAPSAPAAPEKTAPPDFRAAYLDNPPPAYPRTARRRGEEGTALLRVLVSTEGTPVRVELERSSGSNTLDAAAIAGVKSWRFVPATRGGVPTAGWVIVPVVFRLAPES
jgi:protein TonB